MFRRMATKRPYREAGHCLRQARVSAGLTLTQTAYRCQIEAQTLGQYEQGYRRPNAVTAARIRDVLGVEPATWGQVSVRIDPEPAR